MSNSLAELNGFSNQQVIFQDTRAYAVTVQGVVANRTATVNEDQVHQVPWPVTFVQLQSVPNPVIITIDGSSVGSNFITSWSTEPLPQGLTLTSPVPGKYLLSGVDGLTVFNAYRNPFVVAKDRATNYSYQVTVQYPDPANTAVYISLSWTVSVTVSAAEGELSQPSNINWTEDQGVITVSSSPQITDDYSLTGDYTLTITPSNTSALFLMRSIAANPGSYNGATGVMTLTGSRDYINQVLSLLQLVPRSDWAANFNLVYALTNPVSGLITSITQTFVVTSTDTDYVLNNFLLYRQIYSALGMSITDQDPDDPEYTVTVSQLSSSDEWGRYRFAGVEQPQVLANNRSSFTVRARRSVINAGALEFKTSQWSIPGTVSFEYTQIKHDPVQGDIVQANAVSFGGVFTESVSLRNLTRNSLNEDSATFIDFGMAEPADDTDTLGYTVQYRTVGSPQGSFAIAADTGHTSGLVREFWPVTTTNPMTGTSVDVNWYNSSFLDPEDPDYTTKVLYQSADVQGLINRINFMGGTQPDDPGVTYVRGPGSEFSTFIAPFGYLGAVQFRVQVLRHSVSEGTVDLSPVNNVFTYTYSVGDTEYTLNAGPYTAYSSGVPGGATGPAQLNFTIGDWSRINRYDNDPGAQVWYQLRQTTPAPSGNTAGVIIRGTPPGTPVAVWGNTLTTSTAAANVTVYNSANSAATPAVVSSTNAPVVNFYAPPGYSGNITLELDIYKVNSSNVVTQVLANDLPITVTVPSNNITAAPLTTPSTTANIAVNVPVEFTGVSLADLAGNAIDAGNSVFLSSYDITITQSPVRGTFQRWDKSANTYTNLGNSISSQRESQRILNRLLNGAESSNTVWVYRPTSTGTVNFTVNVTRNQHANAANISSAVVSNTQIVVNQAWGAGGVTYNIQ